MRLALINYEYPPIGGGAASATRAIARELVELGHQATVLTSRFQGLPSRELDDGALILRVPCLRKKPSESNPLEMLSFMAAAMLWGPGLLKPLAPQATLAFFGIPCGPVGWWLKKRFGMPYLVLLRGGDIPGFCPEELSFYHRLVSPALKHIWLQAAAVVANSKGARSLAQSTGWGVPIGMIPNGVDLRFFHPPQKTPPTMPIRLLFVGRLTIQKGVSDLLEALALVLKEAPKLDWRLDLVGDGPQNSLLHRRSKELNLVNQVTFKGWLSKEDVAKIYRKSHVFVLPSLDEGMPNVLLEAMASGLACIATQVPGSIELIEQGNTGLLVPPNNPAKLAKALITILGKEEFRVSLGENALRTARVRSWRKVAKDMASLAAESLRR